MKITLTESRCCYFTAGRTACADWVEATLHPYRVRWGAAPKDPAFAALEARFRLHPGISDPMILLHGEEDGVSLVGSSEGQEESFANRYSRIVLPGVGHFPHRERVRSYRRRT